MLAKTPNDNACLLNKRRACEFFASKLAPTKWGQARFYILSCWLQRLHALNRAIYRGLGNLQQMPHRQNLRPPQAIQQLAAIERRCRSAVEQAGGVEQGIFKSNRHKAAVGVSETSFKGTLLAAPVVRPT